MAKILVNFADYLYNAKRKKENTYGGIGYYRQIKVMEQIKDHDVTVIGKEITNFGDSVQEQWDNIFKQYDVFWTSYFADAKAGAAIFYHAQKHKKKVIIDVDDNYLDVENSNPVYDKFKTKSWDRAVLSTVLSFADALTVSTEPLKERLFAHLKSVHGIEKPIYVIPNMNDIKDWDIKQGSKIKDRITIGYTGSSSHSDDLALVLPAIKEIMVKHSNVYFEILGIMGMDEFKKLLRKFKFTEEMAQRIAIVGATETFKEYPEKLANLPWDIGIAPLVDTPFTRCKSHIKWMEYSMFKIPVIASRVYPYFMELKGREIIQDGETGLLVKNDGWFKALDKLITDENLRKTLGENAYNFIKENWQYKNGDINETVNEMLSVKP